MAHLFLVKQDNIYSHLRALLVHPSANAAPEAKEFLHSYHIHLDPLGVLQVLESNLAEPEVNKEIIHQILLQWVDNYPGDFAGEAKRIDIVNRLLSALQSPDRATYKSKLKKILKKDPLLKPNEAAALSTFDFFSEYGTKSIAIALSTHMRNLFEAIPDNEFDSKKWLSDTSSPANVLRRYSETVSSWTASSIVSKIESSTRSAALVWFCGMLFHLYKLKNFTSMLAVLRGLNKISVQRMASLWKSIPSQDAANYETIDSLFVPANNFEKYRKKLHHSITANQSVFPCFEIFLQDVELTEDKKTLVRDVKQLSPTGKIENGQIQNFVMNLPYLDDNTLHEMSLEHYKAEIGDDSSEISNSNSLSLFSFDKYTPTQSNSTITSTEVEMDALTLGDTTFEPTKKSKGIKATLFSKKSLGGLYSRKAPSPKTIDTNKVGYVNKYGYTLLCNYSDLQPDKGLKVKVGKHQLAVFLVGGVIYCIDNKCIHQGVPLAPGDIEEYNGEPNVICPGHGLKFNLKSGACNAKRYTQPVYTTKIKSGFVWGKLK